jgi:hypothetical protein
MRTQFVKTKEEAYPGEDWADTKEQASDLCPWAGVIVESENGFMCFESADDYQTWEKQK